MSVASPHSSEDTLKSSYHTYLELTQELRAAGWQPSLDGMTWVHASGERVCSEALSDLCTMWPAFTGHVLAIMTDGLGAKVTVDRDGVVMTAKVEPLEPLQK